MDVTSAGIIRALAALFLRTVVTSSPPGFSWRELSFFRSMPMNPCAPHPGAGTTTRRKTFAVRGWFFLLAGAMPLFFLPACAKLESKHAAPERIAQHGDAVPMFKDRPAGGNEKKAAARPHFAADKAKQHGAKDGGPV